MSSDDDSIDPVIDRLWYFDSVVSPNPCNPSPPPSSSDQTRPTLLARESSLPLSTGGLSFSHLPFPETTSSTEELEFQPSNLNPAATTQNKDPEMQGVPGVFDDNHGGELSRDELYPWMKTLGLQYTKDGMIQKKPNQEEWNGSGSLDFSTFLLNELIEKESKGDSNEQSVYSESELATQPDVFRPLDKDNDGLLSPEKLRKALANLGLLKKGTDD